jgi:single-strand selective monofunctional uracil DNA glycosylase
MPRPNIELVVPQSKPIEISRALSSAADSLDFRPPVTHVYNPLSYARRSHEKFLKTYARKGIEVLLVGMNPGPWGMAQTGVPFGEIAAVRDWMGITAAVDTPDAEHPKRPIEGFDCGRGEVSGARLWGWARSRFETPENFFRQFFVHNYCPLSFMEESGRNFTPDKLPSSEKEPLFTVCDRALEALVEDLRPRFVLGVGVFAERRAKVALPHYSGTIGRILHPSPASPAANRGWAEAAERDLKRLGIRW